MLYATHTHTHTHTHTPHTRAHTHTHTHTGAANVANLEASGCRATIHVNTVLNDQFSLNPLPAIGRSSTASERRGANGALGGAVWLKKLRAGAPSSAAPCSVPPGVNHA